MIKFDKKEQIKIIKLILIAIWMIVVFNFSNQGGTESSGTSTKVTRVIVNIITKDKEELKKIAPELKKFTKLLAFDREDVIYRGGKVIVPSYYAKGLEFDGVIIVNFDDNTDDLVKYIMATRALHRLKVVNYRMGRI